ncbi:GNAT family N-acetyltransferase [Bacillus mycoides]|uniref:GNAT family N-acetyltransferase n=1 Tax=Bacillus mycoides TaxID=1405 RepID=UPI003CFFB4B7
MMKQVTLLPLDLRYANVLFELSSNPHVKNALGLKVESVEDTKTFILFAIEEERKKHSHIGSWLGYQYWGRGYNESAKKEIFKIAFLDLQLTYVFAGAKTNNIRSLKAQEKLPYISLHVEKQFPDIHAALEKEVKSPCVLHVVSCEKFSNWLEVRNEGGKYESIKN